MNVGLDCFILKQIFSIFIFRNFLFHSSKKWGTYPTSCQKWNRFFYRLCMLSFKHRKTEEKRKGTCNTDIESAQQASLLLFEECVAYVGKVSSFTHRNNCNQCEVSVSPKDNKWTPWGNECEDKKFTLEPDLFNLRFVYYCNNLQRFGFIFCFGGRRKLM